MFNKSKASDLRTKICSGMRYGSLAIAITFAAGINGFFLPSLAAGQAVSVNGGSIQGTITDSSNAAVGDAAVTISSRETGYVKTLKTDASGFYSIGPLNPGTYQIAIDASGFSKLIVDTVVRTGTATSGSYKLSVGQATTEVTVSAAAVQVNTDQPGVSGVINAEQIDTLPINGRNFLDLAQLEPGVQLQDGQSFDPTKAGFSAIAVNGVSGRTTRILLDGQDITDENVGTTIMNVSQGAIDEFQINHSTQDVAGELTSTGQVLVATRSGTNAFHGQAFYDFQDNAAGFATVEGIDVPFQRNQFGGRVGGPIIKDKLFFFASSERIKQDSSTAASLGSRFTDIQSQFATLGSPYRETYSTGRLDYNGPFGGHYFARINYDVNSVASNFGYGYWYYANRDNTPGIAGGVDYVTGKFTHSFRISYEKFHNLIADTTSGNTSLYNPLPELSFYFSAQGLYAGPNYLAPQETYQSDKQFRYDGGWTHGAHNVRFGTGFNRLLGGGYASFFGLAPRASINASTYLGTPGCTQGDPVNCYHVNSIIFGNGQGFFSENPEFGLPAGGQSDWRFNMYIADAWKLRPNFTLTAGLRYSRDTLRANQDLGVIPCSDVDTTTFPNPPCTGSAPLLDQFSPGLGKKVNQPNANFGPQLGFVWGVDNSGKTVVRAGFGVYYDSNVWNNILFDRENRLKSGLFFADQSLSCAQPQPVNIPGGQISEVNGQSLAQICALPLAQSAPLFAQLQQQYQQATTSAGASGNLNPNYVGETLTVNSAFYAPSYVSPYSLQWNFGLQREIIPGVVLSADYVHSATLKIQQTIDVNHDGAARFLNSTAAQNAINATLASNGWASIDDAIANGAVIEDFMGNGLDSGNQFTSGYPATVFGLTPDTGAAFAGANPNLGQGLFNFPNGRAGFDALELNLRQQKRHPFPGVADSNFEVSYTFSKMVTTSRGGSDAFFTNYAWDNDLPTYYMGRGELDHKNSLSLGGSFLFKYGPRLGLIAHFRSAAPSNLTLDNTSENNIFQTDVDGDGLQTTDADLLPGTGPGSYMHDITPGGLKKAVANYNSTYANTLTPAGKALVNAGLFTPNQLLRLNAVQQPIYAQSTNSFSNPMFKSLDANFSYAFKLKFISEVASLEPMVSMYNLPNFANWGRTTGTLINTSNAGSDGSGAYGYVNGTPSGDYGYRNQTRVQRGSGTFDQGGLRSTEFSLRFNF
jgi:Carboxypeptidase regulatory-like domain